MRITKQVLVASLVAVFSIGVSTFALAQHDRRSELMNPYGSNNGGVVRGLDRADQVAGDHGKHGRDNAKLHKLGGSTDPVDPTPENPDNNPEETPGGDPLPCSTC